MKKGKVPKIKGKVPFLAQGKVPCVCQKKKERFFVFLYFSRKGSLFFYIFRGKVLCFFIFFEERFLYFLNFSRKGSLFFYIFRGKVPLFFNFSRKGSLQNRGKQKNVSFFVWKGSFGFYKKQRKGS